MVNAYKGLGHHTESVPNYLQRKGQVIKITQPKLFLLTHLVIQCLRTIVKTVYNNYDEILNFFVNRSTNASAESFNAKIKSFRASLRGVSDINFFLFRLAKIYA